MGDLPQLGSKWRVAASLTLRL